MINNGKVEVREWFHVSDDTASRLGLANNCSPFCPSLVSASQPPPFAFPSHQLTAKGLTMEDKYIGLLLAVSSSVAIGTSFIITKKVRF